MKNKKNLIWIALVAILLVVILLIVFGKKDDTTPSIGNNVATPTLSLEITKIPHSILTSTPKVDEEIIPTAPIIDDKDDKNDTTIKDDIPNFDDGQEATPNPTPQVSEAPKASPTPQISEEPKATSTPIPTQKVEVTPTLAPTSTPKPTSTPIPTKAPSVNGKVELESIGISIPKRDSFNHEALENSKTKTWYGDVDDTKSGQALLDKLDEIRDTLIENHVIASGDQAFLYTDNVITFDYLMKGANSDLELHRDTTNGEYILEINSNLEYDYYKHYDVDFAPYSRDIVKSMLAIILDGDDVENVFSNIYTYLHEDASILSGKTYKEIGNCKVLVDKDASWVNPSNNSASFVFRIKPN